MRSEQQMMDFILGVAKKDERVRAVIIGGSRANPNAPKDFFQDFDIIYVVRDIETFTRDHRWVDVFGERMIMQMPKTMTLIPDEDDGCFTYLMQYMDGNRIDLTLMPVENALKGEWESQSMLLLDKDGIIGQLPSTSDVDFITKKPTAQLFSNCCNEFWWICPYVAKGIWRDELPYAMLMHDKHERDMLVQMIRWYIGMNNDFSVSSGKYGKYFKKFLEPHLWDKYMKTYSDADYDNLWEALFASCNLFRTLAVKVAEYFGFEYPYQDDERVTAHLKHVRKLPRDAETMYE